MAFHWQCAHSLYCLTVAPTFHNLWLIRHASSNNHSLFTQHQPSTPRHNVPPRHPTRTLADISYPQHLRDGTIMVDGLRQRATKRAKYVSTSVSLQTHLANITQARLQLHFRRHCRSTAWECQTLHGPHGHVHSKIQIFRRRTQGRVGRWSSRKASGLKR